MEVYAVVCGPIGENCFIMASEAKNAAIVDPGDDAELIEELLAEKGLTVKMILLTHGHFDHIGAVKQIAEKWNAPVYAGQKEEALLKSANLNRAGNRYGDPERYQVLYDRVRREQITPMYLMFEHYMNLLTQEQKETYWSNLSYYCAKFEITNRRESDNAGLTQKIAQWKTEIFE